MLGISVWASDKHNMFLNVDVEKSAKLIIKQEKKMTQIFLIFAKRLIK